MAHALIPLAAAACSGGDGGKGPTAHLEIVRTPAPVIASDLRVHRDFVVDTIARDLVVPWSMVFTPDGRLLLTERIGRVRAVNLATGAADRVAEIPVYADDPALLPESGLMGIALAPDFASSGSIYLLATSRREGVRGRRDLAGRLSRRLLAVIPGADASPYVSRILELTGRGPDARSRIVVGDLPASFYHAGGALAFGPDSLLYASIGDTQRPEEAQRDGGLAGRILRFDRHGGIPASNPIAGSPEFARGLRNVQAFVWLADGRMVAIDHGPSGMPQEGGRGGNDEINLVRPGANLGWPEVSGRSSDQRFTPPLHLWPEGIAPAGLALSRGGALIVSGLRGRSVRRLSLADDDSSGGGGLSVSREEVLLESDRVRFRALAVGPDGAIYVGTSNRDGRGVPSAGDDLILRLRQRAVAEPD